MAGHLHRTIDDAVEDERERLLDTARELWEHPELSLEEHDSARLLIDHLEDEGFEVESGLGGIPTAFLASYGEGNPRVGILGEYDALPGLSQVADAEQEPVESGAAGHGCGHNLLATGSLGAALTVRRAIEDGAVDGTVVYYGCPAEEVLVGKVFMARDGAFDGLDAALSWHPGDLSWARADSSFALDSIHYTFTGTAAHTGAPQSGHSALDAVQLMNTGAEHLRQYIPDTARLSYCILDGGDTPGIVTPEATSWYYVRATDRDDAEAITERLGEIAQGAATMTRTDVTERVLTSTYSVLHNVTLGRRIRDHMHDLGAIGYDDADRRLARKLQSTIPDEDVAKRIRGQTLELDEAERETIAERPLYDEPLETLNEQRVPGASTDIGNVSRIAPLGRLRAATWPVGTTPHTWQAVAASGSFGPKATLYVAKVLGRTAADLLADGDLLGAVREEFAAETGGEAYVSPIPADLEPPRGMGLVPPG